MYDKLNVFEERLQTLEQELLKPEVLSNGELYQQLAIEHGELLPIVQTYRQYRKRKEDVEGAKSLFEENLDPEMRDLVKEEIREGQEELEELEVSLKRLLLPKDKNDDKDVIIEIRLRQFMRYAERKGWGTEILRTNDIGIGGFTEAVFLVHGKGAYSRLKYESGVHRVQRVPETESAGRIHTSTATVAVLPEVEDVEIEVDMNDVRVDVFRSSGHGGQSVNTTDSAVRMTHIPTGIVVSCQDEKSQLKNKDKALKILKSKLYDLEEQRRQQELSSEKRAQIGTGDRSERIRTYNYPQGRVTDHRIHFTSHRIAEINDGELDELIDALITEDQAAKMREL